MIMGRLSPPNISKMNDWVGSPQIKYDGNNVYGDMTGFYNSKDWHNKYIFARSNDGSQIFSNLADNLSNSTGGSGGPQMSNITS